MADLNTTQFTDVAIDESINFAASKLKILSVKEQQSSAMKKFIQKCDVFCSLPTGYGKSFTFQAFHICYNKLNSRDDSMSLVIFPLRSLIDDQIAKLNEVNISALYIDASTKVEEIVNGKFSLLFATPETLVGGNCPGREILMTDSVSSRIHGIFIDECHVVSKWGFAEKDKKAFRQNYSQLADIRAMLPKVPLMALTATATEQTRKEVTNNLAMHNVYIVEESPNRPNIKLVNIHSSKKDFDGMFSWLIDDLSSGSDRVIIYCRTLKQCTDLYGIFFQELKCKKSEKHPFAMYQSESPSDVQEAVVNSFTKEDGHIRVLFATVAFGMGVDVKQVNTIIHLGVPSDPESFLQESGRAGRDGKPSVSVLVTYPGMYQDSTVTNSMKEYVGNKTVCRRKMILKHFGHDHDQLMEPAHTCCDICELQCSCDNCACAQFPAEVQLKALNLDGNLDLDELPRRNITMDTICELNEKLNILRLSQISMTTSQAANFLAGEDMISGIPSETIDKLVAEAHIVFSFEQFQQRYAIYSDHSAVWDILCETIGHIPCSPGAVGESEPVTTSEDDQINVVDEFAIVCDDLEYDNENIYREGEFANAYGILSSDEDYID